MNSEPVLLLPKIPEKLVVHLGRANDQAPDVEVGFIDYIANVASNEIYPTWNEEALIANIIAQVTFALNRYYTEYYRSRGYGFDITSSTLTDQKYDPASGVYENLSLLADRFFTTYIRRKGSVEPLFALYCDGRNTTCDGLSQFGSARLANEGLSYFEILQAYYGNDIELVTNAEISTGSDSAPASALFPGYSGNKVFILQKRLNRISANYPAIPKIPQADGIYGPETEDAVRAFQAIFGLEQTGIADLATWYEVRQKYNAVKRLNELLSEGLNYDDVSLRFSEDLRPGDRGLYVSVIQYFLNFVSAFTTDFTDVPINGVYDGATEELVRDFQTYVGLSSTGIMDEITWNALFETYRGILHDLPPAAFEGLALPFPGEPLRVGSRGEDVAFLQGYINLLATAYPEIPTLTVDGIFGQDTRDAVFAVQRLFSLTEDGIVDAITWSVIADEYNGLKHANDRAEGQYPGYILEVEV